MTRTAAFALLGDTWRRRAATTTALLGTTLLTWACTSAPPTVTPALPVGAQGQSIELPMNPPPGATRALSVPAAAIPVQIDQLVPYRDPDGAFSMQVPAGWAEVRQPPSGAGDVALGTVFQPPDGSALLTVTHFDNGRVPESLGATANGVMRTAGWMDQPGFRELAREDVLEREGSAMRSEIVYERGNGVSMHSLVLFQIDGTTFSMVHLGVEAGSWNENQGVIRDILASYRVPAAPAPSES
jgi:hypothetical protein